MEFISFGLGTSSTESAEILGGKGAGIQWMSQQGASVPPGFTIPTSIWAEYDKKPKMTMKAVAKEIPSYLKALKEHFGYAPLLSVRSGAKVSMPGMMDTILNVGLDEDTSAFWGEKLGALCFANSYHRLVTMYGAVVKGLDKQVLSSGSLLEAKAHYSTQLGEEFPSAEKQLLASIEAVFKSWDSDRALEYRKKNNIPREWGTAVTVQSMVFGNLNDNSGTGVLFTRSKDTGANQIMGEFAINAQGEDIVAGLITPQPIQKMAEWNLNLYNELISTVKLWEVAKRQVQDVEFTVQDGKLYFLQTRNGALSSRATIKVALDMAKEGLLTKLEAAKRVTPQHYDKAQLPQISPGYAKINDPAFTGIAACAGIVTGKPVYSAQAAIDCKEPCILITEETTPDDVAGFFQSAGIITMKGGQTSHAAVVAGHHDIPCIVGVGQTLEAFKETDIVSMDAGRGFIWLEKIPIEAGQKKGDITEFERLLQELLSAAPIIYDVPDEPLDTALLVVGARVFNPSQAAVFIAKVASQVKGTLYVDFTVQKGPEAEFHSICQGFNPAQKTVDLLAAIPNLGKIILIGPVVSEDFDFAAGEVTDLKSLILADKGTSILIADEVLEPALLKVLAWRKGELSVVSVGKIIPGATDNLLSIGHMLQEIQGVV